MQNLDIRFALPGDEPVLMDFIYQLAVYEKLGDLVAGSEELLAKALFEERTCEAIIGFSGDKPVAFCLFFHNFSTFLTRKGIYIEDLFVIPECRGAGFGRKMLYYVADLAKKRDCGRLEWSCLNWNKPSLDFYRSIGAVRQDEWIGFRLTESAISELARES